MQKLATLLLLFAVLLFTQCKESEDILPERLSSPLTCLDGTETDVNTNDCKVNWSCEYIFLKNSSLTFTNNETSGSVEINPGNNLVFQAIFVSDDHPGIADDENKESLYFEISSELESFYAEGSQLDLLNVHWQRTCFCADVSFKKPEIGCLQGQKIDNQHWQIQGNLSFKYDSYTTVVPIDAVYEFK